MNQILKDKVYGLGNIAQVEFLAELSGMNDDEAKLFKALHYKEKDLTIEQNLNMSRSVREEAEEAVRTKLILAIFQLINRAMDNR